jgi:hypothetical protein
VEKVEVDKKDKMKSGEGSQAKIMQWPVWTKARAVRCRMDGGRDVGGDRHNGPGFKGAAAQTNSQTGEIRAQRETSTMHTHTQSTQDWRSLTAAAAETQGQAPTSQTCS